MNAAFITYKKVAISRYPRKSQVRYIIGSCTKGAIIWTPCSCVIIISPTFFRCGHLILGVYAKHIVVSKNVTITIQIRKTSNLESSILEKPQF